MRSQLATWLLAGSTASALLLAGCQAGTEPANQAPAATTNAAPGAAPPAGPAFTSPAVQEEAASARSEIIGVAAPDFSLPDQDGRRVRLSALRGQWVVVYFYPKDDTPGCTTEATEFTGLMAGGFRPLGARVIGISADPVASHRDFRAKFELGVDLLSDPDHAVMAAYGAWVAASLGAKSYGRVIRSTLLVDPQGVIRYHWPEVIPQGHAERVRQKLAELQARTK
jgi:thioredoxin-dependent peroxiredoxin